MNYRYIFLLVSLQAASAFSQGNARLDRADQLFSKFAYSEAIPLYEEFSRSNVKSPELLKKLGDSYYFTGNYANAKVAYEELIPSLKNQDSEYYFRYIQCLKSTADYEKANATLLQFSSMFPSDSRSLAFNANKEYLSTIFADADKFSIQTTPYNSASSEYATAMFGSKLVISSSRQNSVHAMRMNAMSGQPHYNLFMVEMGNSNANSLSPFSINEKAKYNQASASFAQDKSWIYFTSNYEEKIDGALVKKLRIARAKFENNTWGKMEILPFNSPNYNCAHPALSPDQKYLYFSSDMDGTPGRSDLFRVQILPNGDFGKPQNLGNTINTKGNETFPFVSQENVLYFASDGWLGLGGLDIYASKIDADGNLSVPRNLGGSVNSAMDDFAFIVGSSLQSGYFSSNKAGGKGSDDIYEFKLSDMSNPNATVFDVLTDGEIPDALVYNFGSSKGAKNVKPTITQEMVDSIVQVYNPITNENVAVNMNTAINSMLELTPIYFDFAKFNIRPDAAQELKKILLFLQINPGADLAIRAHTDSRASDEENLKLSQLRANATLEWLVANGIKRSRLLAEGVGEAEILNRCVDDVPCQEIEHALNRRTEFFLIKPDPSKKDNDVEGKNTYRVQKHDTLYQISIKTGISVSELIRLNNIKNNIVIPGTDLKLR